MLMPAVLAGTCAIIFSSPWTLLVKESVPETTASFLQTSAESQQHEIDLGQLAIRKAQDEQVKQFGSRMVEDHQKSQQEIRQLASKEGLHLRNQPSETHTRVKTQLSKLSGKEFDRVYITTIMREHATALKELGQHASMEKDQEVRQWAASAVPAVKEHLAKAKTIASSLGIEAAPSR
jgi:putative membrane protein